MVPKVVITITVLEADPMRDPLLASLVYKIIKISFVKAVNRITS